MNDRTQVEIFVAPGCNKCGRSIALLEALHAEAPDLHFDWRIVDVVAELDYAVEIGIRATPGIAINRRLVFTAQPGRERLRNAILQANHK